jgi:deoxycytidine triphosphate deaminase
MTREDILRSVSTPGGPLQIGNFAPEQLQHTSYYIRLGSVFHRRSQGIVDEPAKLDDLRFMLHFSAGEYVSVTSVETFRLEATVMALLGNASTVADDGITVSTGLTIDPLFPADAVSAPLQFGVKNENIDSAAIRFKDNIAKVCFFDVSDSGPMEVVPGSRSEQTFSERRSIRAMDATLKDGN